MTKQPRVWTLVLLLGCGSSAPPVQPSKSANAAVQGFMQAVADSNLAKMAGLWGTSRGPASETRQPPDYERRIAIMQAYLRNDSYRVISDVADGADRRNLQVQLRRQTCTWNVPFVAVRSGDGSWLVNEVDLTAAGNPARPCAQGVIMDSLPKK